MIAVVADYAPCIALRRAVFMGEQGISEAEEMDDLDDEAVHLLATIDGRPVGTARILFAGTTGKIGRICVLADQRGTGLGARLVVVALDYLRAQPSITTAKLSAQDHAIGFYEKLGFVAQGPFYDDAGIPHKDMVRPLSN
ncbi:drug:proton antiporter [Loktanella sp. D2R18]|uniref:GNAT family N-acetyltransferase n=1 Tax=Rhodobacterales TaxID=204455 RepID=UPI000DE8716C|nr:MULTISPECIES: GNAT family N-acetyltransferase [Rhodobacterales]MDO6591811.1 GNAT family N-acetyltransferase [Yoonia sp. 1_MG-2023]RBW42275.1 drug:proton antiporter [Loktanella sp. D2R18]